MPVRCQAMKMPPRSERGGASGAGSLDAALHNKTLQNDKKLSDALICWGNHFLVGASSATNVYFCQRKQEKIKWDMNPGGKEFGLALPPSSREARSPAFFLPLTFSPSSAQLICCSLSDSY